MYLFKHTKRTPFVKPHGFGQSEIRSIRCLPFKTKTDHFISRPDEQGQDLFLNVEYTWNYLLKRGAKPEKTVLGVPLYGRAFTLENPHDNEMGSRALETSFQGPYTREDGFMGYNEICEELKEPNNGWNVTMEKHHQAPYMSKGVKWVSYDDEASVRKKSQFAYDQGLAGVMTWSIDTDDFTGACTGQKFPLLRAMNNALYMRSQGISDKSGAVRFSLSLVSLLTAVVVVVVAAGAAGNFQQRHL